MKTNHHVAAILAGCALAFAGCSSSGSNGGGSGGQSSSSGGTTGSGGTSSGSGGNGSGGSSSGGSPGSGGKVGSGGTTGSGSGGTTTTGSGGKTGSGGTTTTGSGGTTTTGSGGTTTTGSGGTTPTGSGGSGPGGAGAGGSSPGGASGTGSGGATPSGVTVQLDSTHQTIEGFGINDTYASASLPASLFDATKDIGLTILRVGMNSSGGLITSSVQTTDIQTVKGISGTKIIGSCWTAAASCKSNNSENDGGHLNTSCYTSWATTIANFAKSNGLYAMSIANEPDFASCGSNDPCNGNYPTMLYTATEMVNFVKVAGPMLKAAGVKMIAPETSEWNHLWSNVSAGPDSAGKNSSDPLKCGFPPSTTGACTTGGGYDYGHYLAKDATAWAAIDIIGTHEYDSQIASPWPSDVNGGKPDHEIWETEMSGVKWWPEQGPSSDIANGIAVAGWIHSALVTGEASAWLWWWYSTSSDNEGLMLGSTDTKRHYTLGNYSKFVRPGYVMVTVAGNSNSNLLLSAFKNTDGTVVVVAINKATAAATVPIAITGGTAPASCMPYVTSSTDNLKAGTAAVPVSGGSFTATLGASTVTTFVCK